jgi:hypothetical protein
LLLFSFVLVITHVKADIVYPNRVTLNAQITNLKDFPEVAVVGLTEGGTFEGSIKNLYGGVSISGGIYKDKLFNSLLGDQKMLFYVVKKDYLKKVGPKNIDWQKDAHVQRLNVVNDWDPSYVSKNYAAIDVAFRMVKKKNTYYVYKSKITATPRDKKTQQTDEVKIFKDNVVDPLALVYVTEKWMFSGTALDQTSNE